MTRVPLKVEPFHIWKHRVLVIAKIQDSDLDLIVGGWRQRDRILQWYRDDMTAEMAGQSLGRMTRDYLKAMRHERDASYLRSLVRLGNR